jgi:hypothetical protein
LLVLFYLLGVAAATKCKHCGSNLASALPSLDVQQRSVEKQAEKGAGQMMSAADFTLLVYSKRKSGIVAALLNLFLPGAGYAYCGRWVLGILASIIAIGMFIASFGLAAFGIVLILVIDGFLCASRYNKLLVERMIQERHAETSSSKTL